MNSLFNKTKAPVLQSLLSADLVAFLPKGEEGILRDTVIDQLIDQADQRGVIFDKVAFREAIFNREKIVSTGIGVGVAVPHAKLALQKEFFVCIGIVAEPVEWDAIDGAPVRLVCLIGGPEGEQTQYLQILSQITEAVKDEPRRRQILLAKSGEEVVMLFTKEPQSGS